MVKPLSQRLHRMWREHDHSPPSGAMLLGGLKLRQLARWHFSIRLCVQECPGTMSRRCSCSKQTSFTSPGVAANLEEKKKVFLNGRTLEHSKFPVCCRDPEASSLPPSLSPQSWPQPLWCHSSSILRPVYIFPPWSAAPNDRLRKKKKKAGGSAGDRERERKERELGGGGERRA